MNHAQVTPPYLTDAEVSDMCEPLVQAAAQCKHLRALGLMVATKPNGRPLVLRTELDRVLGAGRFAQHGAEKTAGPNVTALREHYNKRGAHGARA